MNKSRADRCITHHHACDCREYDWQERIQQLAFNEGGLVLACRRQESRLIAADERIQQLTEDHEKDRKFWLSGVNHLKEEHQTEVSKLEQRIQQLETALNEFARATSFHKVLC